MALSNWDTLAFGSNGKSSDGSFKNSSGDFLEIYKNWLHIASPSMWVEKNAFFVKPFIARMTEGYMEICGFEITAKRGPQNGMFVFASRFEKIPRTKDKYRHIYFGGIGCSGYVDHIEATLTKLGRAADINDDWGSAWESGPDTKGLHYIENYKTNEKIVYWDEDKNGEYDSSKDWVGVKKETMIEFFKWLDSIGEDWDKDMKKWVALCKRSKKFRYNQGDAFFTAHAGMKLNATEVGKSKSPTAMKLIAKMGKKKK